jgi:dihydropyrimidinase
VFDPTVRRTLRSADLHGSDYSAWDGWEVHGWPSLVILRGKTVVESGKLAVRPATAGRVPAKLAAADPGRPHRVSVLRGSPMADDHALS